MGVLGDIGRALAEGMAPRGDLIRLRFRISLESLATLTFVLLAIALAVGYQILPRLGTRVGPLRSLTDR